MCSIGDVKRKYLTVTVFGNEARIEARARPDFEDTFAVPIERRQRILVGKSELFTIPFE